MPTLIKTKEALQILGLSNHRFLNYLRKRGLITRLVISPRDFRYKKEELIDLLLESEQKSINLRGKPDGQKH